MPIVADNPRGGSLTVGLFSNRTINIGIVTEIVLLVLITEVPVLQTVFHTAPLGWDDCVYLCCIPFRDPRHRGTAQTHLAAFFPNRAGIACSAPPRWRGQVGAAR